MATDYYDAMRGIAPEGCTCELLRHMQGWTLFDGPQPAEWAQDQDCPHHGEAATDATD